MLSLNECPIRFLSAVLAVLLMVAGCASYEGKKMPAMAEAGGKEREVMARDGSLEVHAIPMLTKESAKPYLGINPASAGMVPVGFRVINNGASPVKVDLSRSYLASKSDERSPCLSLDEACSRARRSDAEVIGWGVAFGVVAMLASANNVSEVNRTLENDYQQKEFKPTLINTGATGEGVLFFDVPKERQPHIRSAVLTYLDIGSNESREIRIDFSGNQALAQ